MTLVRPVAPLMPRSRSLRLVLPLGFLMLSTAAIALGTQPLTPATLLRLERLSEPQLSPDGRHVAYTVCTGDTGSNLTLRQVWLLDRTRRERRPLTQGPAHAHSPRWGADGYLYFLSRRSGSTQLWRMDPAASGEAQAVSAFERPVQSYRLAPDASRVAVSLEVFIDCGADLACTTQRLEAERESGGRTYDQLWVRHWDRWKRGTRRQLFVSELVRGRAQAPRWISRGLDGDVPAPPFGDDREFAFTPDAQHLVFAMRVAGRAEAWSTNLDLWRAPVDGGQAPQNLTAENPGIDTHPLIAPDGRHLLWLSTRRPGYESDRMRILMRDLVSGATREIAPDWDRSPQHMALTTDGRRLLVVADEDGQRPLFSIDLARGEVQRLTAAGSVSDFSESAGQLVYAHNRLDAPDELYQLDAQGQPERLTFHHRSVLADTAFAPYESFRFRGWNDEPVQGWLVKPAGFDPARRYPVVLLIHGGPHSSMGNQFHFRWNPQIYAGRGYAVLFIDFHGSSGYGQEFADSVTGDWGGKPLHDLQKGWAHALQQFPWLDRHRACALGASYGGYMVNWIAGQWPDAFRCLVSHNGIFDLRSMAYATEELWFTEWEMGGTPFDSPEAYERHNPVNHVAKWKTPMLVIHGGQDFRVPLEQGLATFTALQRRGIESKFLHFARENHWVLGPSNSLQWYDAVLDWLDAHLHNQPAPAASPDESLPD